MSNIYAAPEAELIPAPSMDGYGSVERAVTGDYRLDIREVINEAWKKTRGVKGTMLLACGLCYLVYFAVMWLAFLFSAIGLTSIPAIISLIQTLVVTGAMMPIAMGLFILGLRRTMDAPLSLTSIMRHYHKTRLFAKFEARINCL